MIMRMGQIASIMLAAGLATAAAVPAMAQQNYGRAFVSGTGTDAGSCSRRAPCRTLAYAMTQVPAGGQVAAVDTADFGPATISKALSITADDGATVIVHGDGSTDGVTVNAGAGDVVNLRGLALESVPTGLNINSGNVNLEHSSIDGGVFGIIIASRGRTTVSDTTITGPTDTGIVDETSGSTLVLDRVSLAGTGSFAVRLSNASLTMTDSTIVGWGNGIEFSGWAFLKRSVIAGSSGAGILIPAGGTYYLDTTTITGCSNGVLGRAFSYGNNNIVGNQLNINGTLTKVQPQLVRRVAR